jgi:gluconolactonase
MKKTTQFFILCVLLVASCKEMPKKEILHSEQKAPKASSEIYSRFSIEILDDTAKGIIDPNAEIEVLASGFEWTEGPLYIENGDYLLFSDIPNNKVYKLDAQNDTITYLSASGFSGENFTGAEPGSNGLLLNPEGELVLMQHGNRQVAKMNTPLSNPKEEYTTLADNYKGNRFNSPNDGCYDLMGNLYFTDPPYGLPNQMNSPEKELEFQGVYCLLTSGELLLVDKLSRPNGIALSPDNKFLYVAVSDAEGAVWYKYFVKEPGTIASKELMADVTHLIGQENEDGLPDGLKVNRQGIIFATGPGGVWIFNNEGKAIARIRTGQKTANCAFGKDEKKLFMTADDYILAVDLK